MEADASSATEISLAPERVAELLGAGGVEVIDVRETPEWEVGHVGGTAHDMDGGLRAWQERELPLQPDGGHIEGA